MLKIYHEGDPNFAALLEQRIYDVAAEQRGLAREIERHTLIINIWLAKPLYEELHPKV